MKNYSINSYLFVIVTTSIVTACNKRTSFHMGNTSSSESPPKTTFEIYRPPSSPTPSRVKRVRSDIAKAAYSHIDSDKWAFKNEKDDFPANTHKCNKLVHDALKEANASPPTKTSTGQGTWPIQAVDWATCGRPEKAWIKMEPGSARMPGDVISKAKRSENATGHCGIVIGHGKDDVVGASYNSVTRGSHGFESGAQLTRYIGNFPDEWIKEKGTYESHTIYWDLPKNNLGEIKLPGLHISLNASGEKK